MAFLHFTYPYSLSGYRLHERLCLASFGNVIILSRRGRAPTLRGHCLRPIIAIAMAHPRRASFEALCHSRACQHNKERSKPCVILAASWWVSGDGQCVETRRDENTFLGSWRVQHTNTSSMSGDSTTTGTSLFCRDLATRWLTTTREGHSNGWAKGLGKMPRFKFGEPVALGVCRFRDGSGECTM